MPNLVAVAQRVSALEGKRRKCKSAPCGRTFAPPGQFDPMALKSDQGPSGLKVWAQKVFYTDFFFNPNLFILT